jgi:protein polybromo-1
MGECRDFYGLDKGGSPEYYEIIKFPITFGEITKNCKNGEYESVDDLCGDIELMAQNAMRFNRPGSVWHTNGEQLLQLCGQILNQARSSDLPDDASTFT